MKFNSVFIAGTMQGAGLGTNIVDQGYRKEIQDLLHKYYPTVSIICPLKIMLTLYGDRVQELQNLFSNLPLKLSILTKDRDVRIDEITKTFHDILRLASTSDLLIAYLPKNEPSMGTAMEMLQAYNNDKPIICITDMNKSLAILSVSTIILQNLNEFESLLKNKELEFIN